MPPACSAQGALRILIRRGGRLKRIRIGLLQIRIAGGGNPLGVCNWIVDLRFTADFGR